MRTVIVSIPEVHTSYITLDVEDNATDWDIKERANVLLESGDYDGYDEYRDKLDYSHTMDLEMWDITDGDTSHNV